MSLTAEDIVRLFEEDVRARKRLAELLVSEPDVRLALANAILREVATKEDLRELREGLKAYIDARIGGVGQRISSLEQRVTSLEQGVSGLEERISGLEGRIDGLEGRISGVEGRISDLAALVRASLVAIVVTLASTIMMPLMLKLLGL